VVIEKPVIVITSLGRTGTLFFQQLFDHIITDSTSLHEPDYFNFGQYRGSNERIKQAIRQINESGFSNLVIKKALGHWSLVDLSDARLREKLDYDNAVQQVLKQRKEFIYSRRGSFYVESSAAYYGLIDVLIDTYEHHRVAYIVRDGRDWVRSILNFVGMYNHGRIRRIISRNWPEAPEIEGDPYKIKWGSMSQFEKICWAWSKLNEYALATIQDNPNARIFRFEDIFLSHNRYQHLEDLVNFSTTIPGTAPINVGTIEGWLDKRIHKSTGDFPAWKEWSNEHKKQFKTICGPLMDMLGYELDY
jgi:hypothetical protein